jgi:hypothetical protein
MYSYKGTFIYLHHEVDRNHMKKLSPEVVKQVKQMLFNLRKETEKEILKWDNTIPAKDFYSDKQVIETLSFAAYEFCLLKRGIRIDQPTIIQWLNAGVFAQSLPDVIRHTLRWLAVAKR